MYKTFLLKWYSEQFKLHFEIQISELKSDCGIISVYYI